MNAVEREQEAYQAYAETYALQHPPPDKPDAAKDKRLVTSALVVMMVASMIVSASRTIVEFGGGAVGVAAFTMLEVGVVLMTYVRTELSLTSKDIAVSPLKRIHKLLGFGVGLALIVLLGGNLDAVLTGHGSEAAWFGTAVTILIAVSAPLLAFISGDVLALMTAQRVHAQRRLDAEYNAAMSEWRDGLNDSWKRSKGAFVRKYGQGVSRVSHASNALDMSNRRVDETIDNSRQRVDTSRTVDASSVIEEYYDANPDKLGAPVRRVAELIYDEMGVTVGASTVGKVAKRLRESAQDE